MIALLGYNFLLDRNTLDPYPTNADRQTELTIENAQFDEVFLTKDVVSDLSNEQPTEWDINTIIHATLNGNLNGGNILATLDTLDSIRIKRRKLGEFDWILIREIPVNHIEDISFTFEDYTNQNETTYEYAWIPVLNGIEGDYSMLTVHSKFRGTYVLEADKIYRFYPRVSYGQSQQVQQIGTYTPLNRKYPIYVSNGDSNYQTGSMSGMITGNYEDTREFNRKEMVEQKNSILEFLTNKKAKIIKDENGNIWLVYITGNPTVSYESSYGNGMMSINFTYGEVGDPENEQDRYDTGFVISNMNGGI